MNIKFSIILLLSVLSFISCSRPYVFRNHPDFLSRAESAWVIKDGFIFWLQGKQEHAAYSLVLTPGEYMVEFREATSGVKGAALCKVERGVTYTIIIHEKIFMDRAGRFIFNSTCEPTDEYQDREFPDSNES